MEACSLLVNLRKRNAELEGAAVSGEDRCVTTLITAAKETSSVRAFGSLYISHPSSANNSVKLKVPGILKKVKSNS